MILAAYILIALATLSFFVHRTWMLWLPLLVASLICAYLSDIITPWAFLSIGLMWGTYFTLSSPVRGWQRGFTALVAVFISGMLFFHAMPGFRAQILSPHLYAFNYDKPFAGFFILAYVVKIASTKKGFFRAYVRSIPFILGGLVVLLGLSYLLRYVRFVPHTPPFLAFWSLRNLLFVCVPEEAFFRGFLQTEIRKAMPGKWGGFVSIFLATLAFVVIHLQVSFNPAYLIMIFAAGMIFGLVYHLTRSIESAILIHFFTNLLHETVFVI